MDMDLIQIIVLVLVNGLIDCTLVAWLAGRRSKKALTDWLCSGDPEMQAAVATIISTAIVTNVKTGKIIKDEDGKEQEELLPLFKYIGRELSNSLIYKLKAARGGSVSAAGKGAIEDLGSPDLLSSFGPRKGQKQMDWIIEQAAPRLMPIIEKKIAEMVESGGHA
jgi:hypothetical protein